MIFVPQTCFSVGTSYNPKTAASTQHSTVAELKTWLFVHRPENVTTRRYNISTSFCFQWLVVETRLYGMWRKQQVVEIVCCFGSFFKSATTGHGKYLCLLELFLVLLVHGVSVFTCHKSHRFKAAKAVWAFLYPELKWKQCPPGSNQHCTGSCRAHALILAIGLSV